jgi:hypothetical protein
MTSFGANTATGIRLLGVAAIAFAGCSSVHKLAELSDPRLEMDITFLVDGSRIFDMVIGHNGIGNDGCPKTEDSFRGFINDVELDCAPEQPLDQRLYYGVYFCATPRCFLREGILPGDTRRVSNALPTVIRAGDRSIQFELHTGDILVAQDVVISTPQGSIRPGDTVQLVWRGPIAQVSQGLLVFVDQNQNLPWPQGIDVTTTTISGPSIRFNFPPTPPGPGFLQLRQMLLVAQVDSCKVATRCAATMAYQSITQIPVTVAR